MQLLLFTVLLSIISDNYIEKNIFKAKIMESITGIPASIQLAQAIIESGGGKSHISIHSNNHFAIKYYPGAPMKTTNTYFVDRNNIKWRSYQSVWHSYLDHSIFLSYHYPQLRYQSVTTCNQLKGYGSKKGYWKHVHNYIIKHKLYLYDSYRD